MSPTEKHEALTLPGGPDRLVRLESLVDSLKGEPLETLEAAAAEVSFSGDARAAVSVHFAFRVKGERKTMNYVMQHWKTSVSGVLIAIATVAGALEQYGVNGGKLGTSTVVVVVAGVATALLGLVARDPGASSAAAQQAAK